MGGGCSRHPSTSSWVIFSSLLSAILVKWVCLYIFWPDVGWKHAQQIGGLSSDTNMGKEVLTDEITQEKRTQALHLTQREAQQDKM